MPYIKISEGILELLGIPKDEIPGWTIDLDRLNSEPWQHGIHMRALSVRKVSSMEKMSFTEITEETKDRDLLARKILLAASRATEKELKHKSDEFLKLDASRTDPELYALSLFVDSSEFFFWAKQTGFEVPSHLLRNPSDASAEFIAKREMDNTEVAASPVPTVAPPDASQESAVDLFVEPIRTPQGAPKTVKSNSMRGRPITTDTRNQQWISMAMQCRREHSLWTNDKIAEKIHASKTLNPEPKRSLDTIRKIIAPKI
ncbi:MAG: hypothetical protein H7839_21820 [Magnetococcus sp. YQC-5]